MSNELPSAKPVTKPDQKTEPAEPAGLLGMVTFHNGRVGVYYLH